MSMRSFTVPDERTVPNMVGKFIKIIDPNSFWSGSTKGDIIYITSKYTSGSWYYWKPIKVNNPFGITYKEEILTDLSTINTFVVVPLCEVLKELGDETK